MEEDCKNSQELTDVAHKKLEYRQSFSAASIPEIRSRVNSLKGGYARQQDEMFNLPSASIGRGVMLVLPEDIGKYGEVISRWESITLNVLNERVFVDNRGKILFVENLLGEIEKLMWIQWRTTYKAEYESLINIADDPQNITSQIRKVIMLEVPFQGSTAEQDRAYTDLERLACHQVKDLFSFMNDYKILSAKSGKMYESPELSEKFFRKLPNPLGEEIRAAFELKYPGNSIDVLPRINFTYQYLSEQCKKAAVQRSLKELDFCRQIPIPGFYQKTKKYGLRKSTTYRGKPHDTHIRVF